jgi:UDP:flavonoid glycosyltransferase YjiC (YdhE family)
VRVLMTSQPAFSHATQLIPLARELERRGHQVLVATSASFAAVLQQHGLSTRTFTPDWMIHPHNPVYARTVGQHNFFGFAEVPDAASVRDIVGLVSDFQPDLILREYAEFAGWAAAQYARVPLVTQGIIHRLPPPVEDGLVQLVGRIALLAGVEAPASRAELIGAAHLDIVPPSFRCAWEHNNPLARSAQPSLFDGSPQGDPPSWLEDFGRTRPAVYVTLGMIFAQVPLAWRALMAALSQVDVDALVTTGSANPEELGPAPNNVRVEHYVPQSQVLPRCAAVICHAGFNTLIGAFNVGVPTVCIPLAADQPVNAERCAAAGAGVNLANGPTSDPRGALVDPRDLSADDIVDALNAVLRHPQYRQSAERLADEIRAMPSATETARFLEKIARGDSVEFASRVLATHSE